MATPIIKLENIEYYYNRGTSAEVYALKNINIDVQKGEYAAFFGPSGCGKSTLLYLIAGIERPTSGKVLVEGKDVASMTDLELAIYRQSGVGIIFQNFNLIPSISVLENVAMPLSFLGIAPSERYKKAKTIIDRLGIGKFEKRFPFELSGGQQQRVGIARALANDPPLILADEPLGNLDSANANAVLEYLEEFHSRDGRTIIMVTHEEWSLHDAEKIFQMKDGAVLKTIAQKPEKANGVRPERPEQKQEAHIGAPSLEGQAKAYSRFLLRGYSHEEVERLEGFLTSWLKGEMNAEKFQESLDRPFKEGGVGLWRQRAAKITEEVGEFIDQSRNLEGAYKRLLQEPKADISQEVVKLRAWLLGETKLHLKTEEARILDQKITERMKSLIPSAEFVHALNLSSNYGGAGIRIDTAMKLGEKLDTLLGEKMAEKDPGMLSASV